MDASHQRIDNYGLTVVATFCDKLKMLNLSRNKISDNGAIIISKYIKSHTCLLELNLSMNAIHDDGARGIAEVIHVNTVLQKLDLSNNYITSKGAQKIAKAIRANATLYTLDITNNKVGYDGAYAISDSLKTNTSLQSLGIILPVREQEKLLKLFKQTQLFMHLIFQMPRYLMMEQLLSVIASDVIIHCKV